MYFGGFGNSITDNTDSSFPNVTVAHVEVLPGTIGVA